MEVQHLEWWSFSGVAATRIVSFLSFRTFPPPTGQHGARESLASRGFRQGTDLGKKRQGDDPFLPFGCLCWQGQSTAETERKLKLTGRREHGIVKFGKYFGMLEFQTKKTFFLSNPENFFKNWKFLIFVKFMALSVEIWWKIQKNSNQNFSRNLSSQKNLRNSRKNRKSWNCESVSKYCEIEHFSVTWVTFFRWVIFF